MTEQVKVSWKLGRVEMQYEGNGDFLKTELPKLFKELLEIYESGYKNGELEPQALSLLIEKPISKPPSNGNLEWGVNTIAKKMGIKSRKDLVMAACAYLTLVQGKPTFSRDEILDAMREATNFYNKNHTKGLTQYITTLMNLGDLLQRSGGDYAIASEKLSELQKLLTN